MKKNKNFIIIILIFLLILVLIFISGSLRKKVVYEKIPSTEGIHSGSGINGDHNDFTFTISPSGKNLLFLKGNPSYNQNNLFLVSKDLKKGTLEQVQMAYTENSFLGMQVGFSKKCWTIDEKFCIQDTFADNNYYTHAYVSTSPTLKYTESTLKTKMQDIDFIGGNCSDCALPSIIENTLNIFKSKFGEKSMISNSYSIGRSGKMYYRLFPDDGGVNEIKIFNPISQANDVVFSSKSNPDKNCWDLLSISPDENKLAYINSKGCGAPAMGNDLHIFYLVTKRDANYGDEKDISLVSDLSWSPNSKELYFVGGGKDSVLYKMILPK